MQKIIKKYWQNGVIPFLIIGGAFFSLLKFTWLKWGDLIVDVGREMYVPLEILSGKLLYRDIAYLYGPFSPYFNALLYKICGVSLYSLYLNGIITAAAVCFLIYRLSRIFLNIFFSTLAALNFLIVFAFGHYVYYGNYNFILPYTYAAVNAVVFALAAVHFFNRPGLCGFFIFLALLAKVEVGLAVFIAVSCASILQPTIPKFRIRMLFPLLSAAAVYAVFFLSIPDSALRQFVLDRIFLNMDSGYIFTRWMSGIGDFRQNLLLIFKSILGYIFLAGLFLCGAFFAGRLRRFQYRLFILAACAALALFFIKKSFPFDWQFRPLPLICLMVTAVSIYRKQPLLFCLSAFSFLLLVRVLFFVRPGHFGFYLVVPALAAYYIFFISIIPSFFAGGPAARAFYNTGLALVFIFFIAGHFGLSRFSYQSRTLEVSTNRGTIYTFNNPRERNIRSLIAYLLDNTRPAETLVVFPEGLPVNFLAGRANPLAYNTFTPIDLVTKGVSEEIIQGLESQRVDYIAINQRELSEFGCRAFGIDYAQPLWGYIKNNYTLIKRFGPFPYTTDEFGIALFKRR